MDNPLDNNSNPLQHQPRRPFPFWHSRIPFSCSQHSGHILNWTNKPKVLLADKTENPRFRSIPKPSSVLALVWLLCLDPHLDVWKLFDRQGRDCRQGLKQGTLVKDKCKIIYTAHIQTVPVLRLFQQLVGCIGDSNACAIVAKSVFDSGNLFFEAEFS